MDGKRLTFVNDKGGYGHVDDQDQGCDTGEQAECQQEGAKYFCEYGAYQGPAVADVEGVGESIFELAEVE